MAGQGMGANGTNHRKRNPGSQPGGGMAMPGKAWQGVVGLGSARLGKAWLGKAREPMAQWFDCSTGYQLKGFLNVYGKVFGKR